MAKVIRGGTDDYESKLSLMPLVFGTLKGTPRPVFAVGSSHGRHLHGPFMAPAVKRVVKPVMEIMASLPSVVLGFFGALYLAPGMEDKVPALLCMAVLIPGLAALIAWFWTTRPAAWRNKFSRGVEYIVMTPVILLCAWFCWEYLGYWLEQPLISLCRSVMGLWGDGDFQAASSQTCGATASACPMNSATPWLLDSSWALPSSLSSSPFPRTP